MVFLIILVIIPLVIFGMVYAAKVAKKRREDMAVLAQQLGFSFSPDGESIAYWQLDTEGVREFSLVNHTDGLVQIGCDAAETPAKANCQ